MFESWYPFRQINVQPTVNEEILLRKFSYSFKTDKRRYLVLIHEYKYKVFIIKFHDAAHKHLPNRYNLVFNDFNCTKVIRTVIEIALRLLDTEKIASFAFVGVNKEKKEKEFQSNTQRLRIYKLLSENVLGVETFLHGIEPQSNCYLLVNKKNKDPENLYVSIVDMFSAEYNELRHL